MPETKLSKKQIEQINTIYYKYISNKIYKGWGQDLAELEQKEKWPSGPRLKRHEAQRMILGNLLFLQVDRNNLKGDKAADFFFNTIGCRETYTILIQKAYTTN